MTDQQMNEAFEQMLNGVRPDFKTIAAHLEHTLERDYNKVNGVSDSRVQMVDSMDLNGVQNADGTVKEEVMLVFTGSHRPNDYAVNLCADIDEALSDISFVIAKSIRFVKENKYADWDETTAQTAAKTYVKNKLSEYISKYVDIMFEEDE
jgi:exo-beta-1,3-glucanase (GH17 family)